MRLLEQLAKITFVGFITNIILQWFFQPFPSIIHNFISLFFGCVALILTQYKRKEYPIIFHLIIILMISCSIVNAICIGTSDFGDTLWQPAYFGFACLLLTYKFDYKYGTIPLIFTVIYFAVGVILNIDPSNMVKIGSQNNISSIIIFFIFIDFIVQRNNEDTLSLRRMLLLSIYYVLIGVWTASRATLVCAVVFFVLILFMFLYQQKHKWIYFIGLSTVFLIIAIVVFNIKADLFTNLVDRLKYYGLKSERTEIWSEYLDLIFNNVVYLLFGGDVSKLVSAQRYAGNLHNSLFMLHAHYGLLPFLLIIYSFAFIFIELIRKKQGFLLSLVIVYFLRLQFDWVSFSGVLDIIFYCSLLIAYENTNQSDIKDFINDTCQDDLNEELIK